MRTQVAIVGAGPGGLSAGIALSQAGFDAKIFERNETVDALGGAILLNAIGIYILRSYAAATQYDRFTSTPHSKLIRCCVLRPRSASTKRTLNLALPMCDRALCLLYFRARSDNA